MKFLMRAFSSNADYNADIEYVWVDVTKELAQIILARRKLFLNAEAADKKTPGCEHSSLWEMYFGNHHARYFSNEKVPEELGLQVFDDTGEPVETDWDPGDDDGERTECDQMIVAENGVRWTTIPKHTDIYITSETIPFSKIEECL